MARTLKHEPFSWHSTSKHEPDVEIEESLKSIQFQWLVAQTHLQSLERTQRELRITSLVMTIVFLAASGLIFGGGLPSEPSLYRVSIVFASIWWSVSYCAILWLPAAKTPSSHYFDSRVDIDSIEFAEGLSVYERARLLESAKWQVRRTRRMARMSTLLVINGMLLSIIGVLGVVSLSVA